MRKIFETADSNEEKVRCLAVLGKSPKKEELKEHLTWMMSSSVRDQDKMYAISSIIYNRHADEMTWVFMQNKWEDIIKIFPGGFLLSRIISFLDTFSTHERATEVETFFSTRDTPSADRAVKQVVEKINFQAGWLARDSESLRKFFSS